MTKDEAIAWAARNIAEGMEYEYYTVPHLANRAAEALTLLSGEQWTTKLGDEDRIWVVKAA